MVDALGIGETEDGGAAKIGLVGVVVQRSKELGSPVIGREIYHRQVGIGIYGSQHNGQGGHNGSHALMSFGSTELLEWSKGYDGKDQQHHILPETLGMR